VNGDNSDFFCSNVKHDEISDNDKSSRDFSRKSRFGSDDVFDADANTVVIMCK